MQRRRSHRIIGGHKGRLGDEVPQKLKLFCETTRNICIKIQQTTVAVILVDILNNITSKILGDITMDVPLHKYWGYMSPCPIGIDAPANVSPLPGEHESGNWVFLFMLSTVSALACYIFDTYQPILILFL